MGKDQSGTKPKPAPTGNTGTRGVPTGNTGTKGSSGAANEK